MYFYVSQNSSGYILISFSHKYDDVMKTVNYLKSKTDSEGAPLVGIICGSGLGGLAASVENKKEFEYKDIPNFPISTGNIRLLFSFLFHKSHSFLVYLIK